MSGQEPVPTDAAAAAAAAAAKLLKPRVVKSDEQRYYDLKRYIKRLKNTSKKLKNTLKKLKPELYKKDKVNVIKGNNENNENN
jgi:hypothetical protein